MRPATVLGVLAACSFVPLLAACGESTSSGAAPPATSTAATTPAERAAQPAATPGGKLTPPGTTLAVGERATVGWVPLSQSTSVTGQDAVRMGVVVDAVEEKTQEDLKNVDLPPSAGDMTPWFVRATFTQGGTGGTAEDDPDIKLRAKDSRDEVHQSITFFGTFKACDNARPPDGFGKGDTYSTCLVYLIPRGATLAAVEWNDGPSEADAVTPYFSEPVAWKAR